jgi:hypothetical protein
VSDRRRAGVVVGGCVATSALALLLPVTLAYDPWTWLVWGREVAHLDLDTTGGPSWKPLPVLVTAPLTALGQLAPTAWLVIARAGGLLALVGAHRLGRRLAGPVAGWLAAGFLVLTPDGGPRFVRLVLEGHSAPWTAAFALWAVDQHLAGRPTRTLALLTLLAWDRPEAWPFLLLYGVWLAREHPARRWLVAAALVSVAILWFGADWWGSGSPLHGAGSAQVYDDEPGRLGIALEHTVKVVLAPVWVLALLGGARAQAHRQRTITTLVGGALVWIGLVTGMNGVLGYAALTRFLLPAAALLCVVAAVTIVQLVEAAPAGRSRGAIAVGLLIVCAPFAAQRALAVRAQSTEVAERARVDRALASVVDAVGGATALRACAPLTVDTADVPRAALAWRAELPAHGVDRAKAPHAGTVVATTGGVTARALADDASADRVAGNDRWEVFRVGC